MSAPTGDGAKCWLRPKRGWILAAALTEDQTQPTTAGGIIKPDISAMSFSGRIYGVVLAVGLPPRTFRGGVEVPYDGPWPELDFGDYVELSRWPEGHWWTRPLWALWDEPGEEARRVFAPADGGPERYTVTNRHYLAVIRPEDVICRWARREWVFGRKGEPPKMRPVADRVLIRNVPRIERLPSGLYLPNWMQRDEPIGEVVGCGWRVENVTPGDWALVRTDRGTRLKDKDGTVYTSLRERDVIGRWDEEPSAAEKLRYSAELKGVKL